MKKKILSTNKSLPNFILKNLKIAYPDAKCALDFNNPFELLVATILSAQCTDKKVNLVTPSLFKKYPDPLSLSQAKKGELEKLIYSTGFFKNKARSLIECSKMLVEKFHGRVPNTIDELSSLRGVGRKTANVVLQNAFNISSGVVVDTHVTRLSLLLGLSISKNPDKIEKDLQKLFPKKSWILLSHLFIMHGRNVCIARRPECFRCVLKTKCPSIKAKIPI